MSSQGGDQQSNAVHFFKIILGNTGKLEVPSSFVKRHWEGITNPVSLRLPNGTERKVSWTKTEGKVSFCDGWKEFADHVSLAASQFVVFRFEDNSRFSVMVFAKSGLEIKYPQRETATENQCEEVDQSSDCSLKILENDSSFPSSNNNKRGKSTFTSPFSETCKKMKTNPKEQKECHVSDERKVEAHSGSDNANHTNSGSKKELKDRIKAFHEKVKLNFHSEKEFFTCAIQKTYTERDLLIIPNEFSNPHLHKTEGRIATLFDDRDRTWDVKLKRNSFGHMTFTIGWRKFLGDNNLKVGDVCVFVLNKSQELAFQVFAFPLEKDLATPMSKDLFNTAEKDGLSHKSSSSSLKTPEIPLAKTD